MCVSNILMHSSCEKFYKLKLMSRPKIFFLHCNFVPQICRYFISKSCDQCSKSTFLLQLTMLFRRTTMSQGRLNNLVLSIIYKEWWDDLNLATTESKFQKQPLEVFYKKVVFENFAKFTGKHLCRRLFFNKTAGLRPTTLLKKRLRHKCFPVNFAKCLRTPFFTEHLPATASGI